MLTWPFKDPDEILDYEIDWTAWLFGDTISTSIWLVPAGINNDGDDKTTKTTTIWLSGGTIGKAYELTNRITTAAGRIADRTVKIKIKAK